jgi:hypothetical protein
MKKAGSTITEEDQMARRLLELELPKYHSDRWHRRCGQWLLDAGCGCLGLVLLSVGLVLVACGLVFPEDDDGES